MRKLLTGVMFCLAVSLVLNAQTSNWESSETDMILDTNIYIPEEFESSIDSLFNSWYVKYYVKQRAENSTPRNIQVSDAVYKERLSHLPNIIEMPYNEVVRNCIDLYVNRRGRVIEYMLGLADFYFPMIEQILDEHQLPHELKYLAIVESALNPTALSRAGATGLWQFMLPTGKAYGLEINSLVDERRDPVKATYAACKYFKDMYAIYGDWHLVIASYNCGPGNVNKAIRRADGKRNYWDIYNYLPKETRSYVPLFIAANYAMNYYSEHGLTPVSTSLPLAVDTVMVGNLLHFDQIAEVLSVDKELLRVLNPQYKRDIIPGHSAPRPLRLPTAQTYAFVNFEDSVHKYKSDNFFGEYATIHSSLEKLVHTVGTGETMNSIANKYGVTVAQVKRWNGLRSSNVRIGSQLTVYIDNGGVSFPESDSAVSEAPRSRTSPIVKPPTRTAGTQSKGFVTHQVRQGESFSTISKKYNVTVKALMDINKTNSSKLRVGQIIKVPKKGR